jgi:aminoglycoside phosphotransferase (APT) family kinase protein
VIAAPDQARWVRPEPRRTLPAALLERMVHAAFPCARIHEIEPLTGGLRNANYKLRLDSMQEDLVLRIFEHDASLCQKELDLLQLIGDSVPVPEVLYAEPHGMEDTPPFTLVRYIEGITFRELKRSGDRDAIAQAAYSAGQVLASIGHTVFPKSGWLAPGPNVIRPLPEGVDPVPRFVDLYLASPNLQRRMDAELRDRTHALVWSWAPQIASLGAESCLVHGDFGKRNLLVRRVAGKWKVAGVLDWEFAVSGAALIDLGHFLRYERATHPLLEPHFSSGYLHAGGNLPRNWRQLARVLDVASLCESLTHDELPDSVVTELIALVREAATCLLGPE